MTREELSKTTLINCLLWAAADKDSRAEEDLEPAPAKALKKGTTSVSSADQIEPEVMRPL